MYDFGAAVCEVISAVLICFIVLATSLDKTVPDATLVLCVAFTAKALGFHICAVIKSKQ